MRSHLKKALGVFSKKKRGILSGVFAFVFLFMTGIALFPELSPDPSTPPATSLSSELNIADSSPLGDAAGLVVPASCPSNLHDAPTYGWGCTSAPNACGQWNWGTIQCGGACSASTPPPSELFTNTYDCSMVNGGGWCYEGTADITFYCDGSRQTVRNGCYAVSCCVANEGASCSAANFCGQTSPGTIQCNGSCNATAPPMPANYGQLCMNANSCGMTGRGYFECDGSCNAVPPSESLCCVANAGAACSASNACGQTSNGTIQCNGACSASAPANPWYVGMACNTWNSCWTAYNSGTLNCSASCSASAPANPAGYGNTCSASNACGQTSSGTIQCNGACSASAPALPAGYGNACVSAPNACGQRDSGTIQCNGSCSATPPANPANYGNACTSAPNTCGMTSSGTIQCNGSCSAVPPDNSLCGGPPCVACQASNACGMTSAGLNCGGGCDATPPSDALCVDTYTITASAGVGGTIAPNGTFGVTEGSNQSFTITPNAGYVVSNLVHNGFSVGAPRNYTISNITGNHTLVASFAPVAAPVITSFTANPANLPAGGGNSTLTWTVTGATSCFASGGWSGWKASSGSSEGVAVGSTTTYTLECWNAAGVSSGSQSRQVTVAAAPGAPTITSFTANPANLPAGGGNSTLTWAVSNATSCWASGGWSGWKASGGSSEGVAVGSTTTYTLECWNAAGVSSGSQSRQVTVAAAPAGASGALSNNPAVCTIPAGGATCDLSFTWSSSGTSGNVRLENTTTGASYQSGNPASTQSYPITHGVNTVVLRDDGGILATALPRGQCDGSVWNGSRCVAVCTPTDFCANHAADIARTCIGRDYVIANDGCGERVTCPGTQVCDYNWKEVAP